MCGLKPPSNRAMKQYLFSGRFVASAENTTREFAVGAVFRKGFFVAPAASHADPVQHIFIKDFHKVNHLSSAVRGRRRQSIRVEHR